MGLHQVLGCPEEVNGTMLVACWLGHCGLKGTPMPELMRTSATDESSE